MNQKLYQLIYLAHFLWVHIIFGFEIHFISIVICYFWFLFRYSILGRLTTCSSNEIIGWRSCRAAKRNWRIRISIRTFITSIARQCDQWTGANALRFEWIEIITWIELWALGNLSIIGQLFAWYWEIATNIESNGSRFSATGIPTTKISYWEAGEQIVVTLKRFTQTWVLLGLCSLGIEIVQLWFILYSKVLKLLPYSIPHESLKPKYCLSRQSNKSNLSIVRLKKNIESRHVNRVLFNFQRKKIAKFQ